MMGHLEVVKWLLTNHTYLCFSPSATSMVARNGNLEMLQWIHRQENQGCTTSVMNYAAGNSRLKIVRWLQLNRTEGCTVNAMDFAVEREHFKVLLYLRANRTKGCRFLHENMSKDTF
ncbi:hypothetical protein JG687_00011836 [Phytophthora cactorum]|uniref:Ankyrin repeat-containing domain n=1 Tax=Phytophthora cactorum TaxID=29920 RepID=A0A8T1U3I5_9STRA|nr:hypothetical protein JG687_00011836 [Phytophthora cactorum]